MSNRRFERPLASVVTTLLLVCAGRTSSLAQAPPSQPTTRVFFIFFAGGAVEIKPTFEVDLREAACHVVGSVIISVRGFTNRAGSRRDNQLLSEQRAVRVASRLARYGVPCDKPTSVVGLGEEATPGRSQNGPFSRRVDVVVEGRLPSSAEVKKCMQDGANTPKPSPAPICKLKP